MSNFEDRPTERPSAPPPPPPGGYAPPTQAFPPSTPQPAAGKSNKTMFAVLGALAVIALGIGAFFLFKGDDKKEDGRQTGSSQPTEASADSTDRADSTEADKPQSDDDYTPGPIAREMMSKAEGEGFEFSTDELRCFDQLGDDFDPDVLDPDSDDMTPEQAEAIGKVMDDCMTPESRSALLSGSFGDEALSADESKCLAEKIDKEIMAAGGYTPMYTGATASGDMEAIPPVLMRAIMSAALECNIDITKLAD